MVENNENLLNLTDRVVSKDRKLRTLIMAGYDPYVGENGVSYLGEEVIERQENKVVLGGILHILKKLFGSTSTLSVRTLNEIMGIGTVGTVDNTKNSDTVFGFNIGIDGCGSSYADIKETLDQEDCVPGIIPIRVVDDESELGESSSDPEDKKYWFKKKLADGKTAYYIKTFESTPTIHSLWKDAVDQDADGNSVTQNPNNDTRTEGIESFAEITIRIAAEDLREYFQLYGGEDGSTYARFNSIGLCFGDLGTCTDDDRSGEWEYLNTTQFSILKFSNEMLHFGKDLTIIYRVYLS